MEVWMQTVIDSEPWDRDPNVIAVPWRRVKSFDRPLRLGVVTEDASRYAHPTVLRTITSAVEALKKAGHTIVDLTGKVPSIWESSVLSWKYFALDPEETPFKILKEVDEPIIASIPTTFTKEVPPGWHPSVDDLFGMNMQRFGIVAQYHKLVMENELDGFIMPAYQATAVPHDTYGIPIYTVLPNLINYPAGVIPYLKADKEADKAFVREVAYEPPCKS
jgi:Asp-tRNA(Asn)/Glu-tRNA(Gln) amidotransferase A subunit family amidase